MWVLNLQITDEIKKNYTNDADDEFKKITNSFINNVTENLSKFTYNKIIANFHEIHSTISKLLQKKYTSKTIIENYKKILICMMPVIPHFANECIELLEDKSAITWPNINKKLLIEENINSLVSYNSQYFSIFK